MVITPKSNVFTTWEPIHIKPPNLIDLICFISIIVLVWFLELRANPKLERFSFQELSNQSPVNTCKHALNDHFRALNAKFYPWVHVYACTHKHSKHLHALIILYIYMYMCVCIYVCFKCLGMNKFELSCILLLKYS